MRFTTAPWETEATETRRANEMKSGQEIVQYSGAVKSVKIVDGQDVPRETGRSPDEELRFPYDNGFMQDEDARQ